MPRDYSKALNGSGRRSSHVSVPKWALGLGFGVLVLWAGWGIFSPTAWTIQRLDSPDGRIQARLTRVLHSSQHFAVEVKTGGGWRTYYHSPALPTDFKVDLGERLVWSGRDRLLLRMEGRFLWGYDFARGSALTPKELEDSLPFKK